jgi:hypothetical protein
MGSMSGTFITEEREERGPSHSLCRCREYRSVPQCENIGTLSLKMLCKTAYNRQFLFFSTPTSIPRQLTGAYYDRKSAYNFTMTDYHAITDCRGCEWHCLHCVYIQPHSTYCQEARQADGSHGWLKCGQTKAETEKQDN